MARRWRLDIATMTPRYCRAGSSASPRWCPGIVALVHRHRRAGASASTTLSRWRTGVVMLVHVSYVALCLSIAALARREREKAPGFAQVYMFLTTG
jgi:hypothetical protein